MAGYGGQQQYNGGPSTPKAHQRRGMEKDPEEALEMELTPPKSPSRSPFKSPWNRPLGNKNNDSRKPNPFGTIGEKSNRPSAAAGAGRIPPNKTKTSPKDFNYSVLKPGKVSYIGKGPPRAGSVRNPRSRFFPEDTKSRRALALEQLFRGFNEPISSETLEDEDRVPHSPVDLPPEFKQRLEREKIWGRGFNDDIVRYYTEDMSKYDSRSIPGRGGNPSLLEDILKAGAEDRLKGTEGPGWRPVRYVGKGGQGLVTLWEHKNEQNEVHQLVTKDLGYNSWFEDYSNEAQYTKRLNDRGCRNVINVVEWTTLPNRKMRVAYEFAEYGDLWRIKEFYYRYHLKIPEAFLWHVFHSMALALSYCHLGHASTTTSSQSSDWEEINHADLKEDNILMFPPTPITTTNGSGQTTSTTSLNPYPHLKLADFGLSFTMPNRTIRTFKSSRWNQYGTPGYQAPEITMHNPFHQQPQPHQQPENQNPKQKFIIDPETNTLIREKQANPYPDHGAHTDIYALGRTIQSLAEIAFPNHTIPTNITTTNTNTPNTNTPNTNTPNTNTNDNNENTQIYTPALLSLLSSCLHPHGPSRISTSNLLKETSIAYQTHLTLIQTAKQAVEKESTMTTSKEEEEERGNVNGNSNGIANGNSIFQIYPGRILYTQSEKNLFLRNPFFRRAFEELNQVPFRKKSPPKIPPRPNIIRGKRRYKGNDQKSSSIRAAAAEAEAAAAGGIGEGKRGGKLNGGEHPPEFKVLNDADGDGDEDVDDDVVFGKEFVSVGAGVGKVIGRESGRTNEELQQFEDLKFHSPIQPLQPLPPPPPQPPVLVAIPKETKKKSAEGENGNNLVDEVGVGGGPGGRVGNRNRNRNRNLMGLDGVLESAMRRRGGRGRGL